MPTLIETALADMVGNEIAAAMLINLQHKTPEKTWPPETALTASHMAGVSKAFASFFGSKELDDAKKTLEKALDITVVHIVKDVLFSSLVRDNKTEREHLTWHCGGLLIAPGIERPLAGLVVSRDPAMGTAVAGYKPEALLKAVGES